MNVDESGSRNLRQSWKNQPQIEFHTVSGILEPSSTRWEVCTAEQLCFMCYGNVERVLLGLEVYFMKIADF